MSIATKKPILLVGVTLSFVLLLWQNIQSHLSEFGEFGFWGLIIVSGCFWFLQPQKNDHNSQDLRLTSITETKFNEIIKLNEKLINDWERETKTLKSNQSLGENQLLAIHTEKNNLLTKLQEITEYYHQEKSLNLAIIGSNKFSNSTLEKIIDIPEKNILLNVQVVNNLFSPIDDHNSGKQNLLLNYDLVLFIIHGDLTDSEKQILLTCRQQQQQILLLFNNIDYSSEAEKNIIFNQLKLRINDILLEEYLLKIATNTQTIKVKKYQDKENYQEWQEIINPQCDNLLNLLNSLVNNNALQLKLNTAYRKAIAFKENLKNQLNEVRKEKAIPLIEKYQIIAASATFANPVASLDLLATAAINTQMIVDLSNIYQQKLSLNQAQNIAVTLAKLMVKLGIVELSTQTITTVLKTNAITFIAGGIIQGVSTAYLTKICGLSLIEYLATTEISLENNQINLNKIKEKLQSIFSEYKQKNIITNFVQKTAVKLAQQQYSSLI